MGKKRVGDDTSYFSENKLHKATKSWDEFKIGSVRSHSTIFVQIIQRDDISL